MKKVLFILPSLNVGGLERVQVTLANKLTESGYDVTVMTLGLGDELRTELDSRVHFVYKPLKPHPFMKQIPYFRHRFYDDGMWETRATPEQLHEYYIADEHYDVEIGFFRGLAVKIVSGGSEIRDGTMRIAWVHSDFRRAVGYKNNFKSMYDVYNAYASLDHVVCVSNEAKQGFKDVIGDTGNLITIYNMLPVESIKQKAKERPSVSVSKEQLHLVLVGRLLDSAKGQKRMIDVVSRLHDEGKSISLALVGGGGDERLLKDEIATNHAEGYITICGNQMNPYPFIKEADVLVCGSYFEGYNLTVAEALILGVPVLSTDCTGPNEILDYGKYGMVVENSEEGLYKGIKELYESPEKIDNLKRCAIERKHFFDEETLLHQIEEVLQWA